MAPAPVAPPPPEPETALEWGLEEEGTFWDVLAARWAEWLVELVWLFILLSLLNWVRTRRLALVLLLLFALDVALRECGGVFPYPAAIATMGLAMLLIRLFPHWRLLRRPRAKRVPRATPIARGILETSPWPNRTAKGVTTISVLIAFIIVLVVAGAAVSCFARAAQVSRSAERSFVALALLEGELERVRAGELTPANLKQDLSSRAGKLLPNARARVHMTPQDTPALLEVQLELTWQDVGRPRHAARQTSLIFTGGRDE